MHIENGFADPAFIYQPIWKSAGNHNHSSAGAGAVVHAAIDSTVQAALQEGLRDHDIDLTTLSAMDGFTSRLDPRRPACVLIDADIHNSDVSSLLGAIVRDDTPPIILIGRCENPRVLVRAMKSGAFDYLQKTLDVRELIGVIVSATDQDRRHVPRRLEERTLRSRMALLTPREREVLPLVVGGLLNKQAASLLGISEITLQIHRGQVMRKMQADSLADLVRMCMKLRVRHWRPTT